MPHRPFVDSAHRFLYLLKGAHLFERLRVGVRDGGRRFGLAGNHRISYPKNGREGGSEGRGRGGLIYTCQIFPYRGTKRKGRERKREKNKEAFR